MLNRQYYRISIWTKAIWNIQRSTYRGGRFSSFIDIQDEASEGDVISPFVHQDKVNLVKIYETTEEEQAKVRHILITSKEGDEDDAANKRLADSILYQKEILANLLS